PAHAGACCRSVCSFRYADDMCAFVRWAHARADRRRRVLLAEAVRDGLRLEAISADIASDGDSALEALSVTEYDIALIDRDIPGPSGDEVARRIVASGEGPAILMLTAADRLHDKETGFELGADDYLTKPFAMRELVLRIAPSPDAETDGDRRSSKP